MAGHGLKQDIRTSILTKRHLTMSPFAHKPGMVCSSAKALPCCRANQTSWTLHLGTRSRYCTMCLRSAKSGKSCNSTQPNAKIWCWKGKFQSTFISECYFNLSMENEVMRWKFLVHIVPANIVCSAAQWRHRLAVWVGGSYADVWCPTSCSPFSAGRLCASHKHARQL